MALPAAYACGPSLCADECRLLCKISWIRSNAEGQNARKKHWAVVRKSVLPEKDEFLEKANKGKTEEWLEHWKKRRKTQTKLKQLMRHLRLAVRDFNVKDMFIRFTEGNKFPPTYPRDRKVPLWRPANKTSLTAILHMLDLNLTRNEVVLARNILCSMERRQITTTLFFISKHIYGCIPTTKRKKEMKRKQRSRNRRLVSGASSKSSHRQKISHMGKGYQRKVGGKEKTRHGGRSR